MQNKAFVTVTVLKPLIMRLSQGREHAFIHQMFAGSNVCRPTQHRDADDPAAMDPAPWSLPSNK